MRSLPRSPQGARIASLLAADASTAVHSCHPVSSGRITHLATLALIAWGCGALPEPASVPSAVPRAAPSDPAARVRGGGIPPIPDELCGHPLLPGSYGGREPVIHDVAAARLRAQEFIRTMSASTGVFLPPDDPDGEWGLGVLSLDAVGERASGDGWQFAFPFECPPRRDVTRVVYVTPRGSANLLYPPVEMPGWQPMRVEPLAPASGELEHPELIGIWSGGTEDGVPCMFGPFTYDGREVLQPVYAMRDWEFRTEDNLVRFPARWRGRTLQIHGGRSWRDFAALTDDGAFVVPGLCPLDPSTGGDPCWFSAWSRPHPVIPPDLPINAGPMMMRCDAAGSCTTNQASLVAYLCEMHGGPGP